MAMADAITRVSDGVRPHPVPGRWIAVAAGVAVAYAALLAVCEFGTRPTDRIFLANPPPPAGPQTFLGLRDSTWFPILYGLTALVLAGMLAGFVVHYRRSGTVHPAALVLAAFTTFAIWDPLINWATFTVFSPDMIHYPLGWAWMNISPVVETPWAWGGYGLFYVTPMLGGFWLYKRYRARHNDPASWAGRHPLLALWGFGTVFGFVVDVPQEIFLINMNIWHYWQHWGPAISIGYATLPLTEIFWTGMLIGTGMVLLHRDDRGRSALAAAVAARPGFRRLRIGEMAVVLALLTAVYAGYLGTFGLIRVLGLADQVERVWPISTSKVYDPYGAAAGVPGPHFAGIGAWSLASLTGAAR